MDASIAGTGFSNTKMIMTSGEYSDGGLEFFYDDAEQFIYPIGTNANSSTRYTPATAYVAAAVAAGRSGYVVINPVDDVLATTVVTGATNDILSFYWRVRYRDFTVLPSVAYKFSYVTNDIANGSNEGNWVAGKVLDVTPYTTLNRRWYRRC